MDYFLVIFNSLSNSDALWERRDRWSVPSSFSESFLLQRFKRLCFLLMICAKFIVLNWCAVMESNHPSPEATDLQSVPLPLRYNDAYPQIHMVHFTSSTDHFPPSLDRIDFGIIPVKLVLPSGLEPLYYANQA